MLNLTPEALSKKIVEYLRQDICVMDDIAIIEMLKRWKIDIQKILSDASCGITYKAFFDGSATPNPGQMVIGGYIEEAFGRRIYEYSYDIGYGTNNEAEYTSLLHLCHIIVSHQILKVRIHGDSNLIINQVNGVYKAKHEKMIAYRDEVRDVLKLISEWNLMYIPRKQNKQADALT